MLVCHSERSEESNGRQMLHYAQHDNVIHSGGVMLRHSKHAGKGLCAHTSSALV